MKKKKLELMHLSLPCLNIKVYFLVLPMHNSNPLCANFF